MPQAFASPPSGSRLRRLLGFLDQDPTNLRLLADAAQTAMDEGCPDHVPGLLERYARLEPLPPNLANLGGLAALETRRYSEALGTFEDLLAVNPDEPQLRFNLAWSKAMLEDWEGSLALLDDATLARSPGARPLKVRVLHQLGRLDEALAAGGAMTEQHAGDCELAGALAAVAVDAERLDLARRFAEQAGDQHDGLAALGLLTLNEDRVDDAIGLFERALAACATDARAWLGKGLSLMAKGETAIAARDIDAAAELFGTHLGSWVAAGWAYFAIGDYATSRARFETALAIDDTFAEIHGGLAVLDVVAGQLQSAERRTEIALRLDRNCFSGALARVLLLNDRGDVRTAERVRDIALNTKVGGSGRTIAQAMASLSLAPRRPPR